MKYTLKDMHDNKGKHYEHEIQGTYMLAQIGRDKFAMINLYNGNRHKDDVSYDEMMEGFKEIKR